jgi:hypothetical protein
MLSGKFDPEHAEGLQKPGRGQAPDIDRLEASIGHQGSRKRNQRFWYDAGSSNFKSSSALRGVAGAKPISVAAEQA